MENIKVSVKHNSWSEVFDMLVELGGKNKASKDSYGSNYGWLFLHNGVIWTGVFQEDEKECREVVLRELKDMVVLKRNSVAKDQVKPIEKKEMEEYLDKDYVLRFVKQTNGDNRVPTDWIEVPEGADTYTHVPCEIKMFYKENFKYCWHDEGGWTPTQNFSVGCGSYSILWEREAITKTEDKTIDGVEAFNAIANDITVQYRFSGGKWKDYTQDLNHNSSNLKAVDFLCDLCEFRYKPKTIVVNGVEYEDERDATNAVKDYFKGEVKC